MRPDEHIDFLAIRLSKLAKEPDIEWLGWVGGMWRQTDRNNVLLFAIIKIDGLVALVAVQH